jgi:hypothetical protein
VEEKKILAKYEKQIYASSHWYIGIIHTIDFHLYCFKYFECRNFKIVLLNMTQFYSVWKNEEFKLHESRLVSAVCIQLYSIELID